MKRKNIFKTLLMETRENSYFLNIFFKNKHSQKQEKKNETKMQMDDLNIR